MRKSVVVDWEDIGDVELKTRFSMVRCACGSLQPVAIPTKCSRCEQILPYWKDFDRNIIHLSDMDLAHLSNAVRLLGLRAETAPSVLTGVYELALDLLYAEIATRDQEIQQASGIMAALQRSLAEVK